MCSIRRKPSKECPRDYLLDPSLRLTRRRPDRQRKNDGVGTLLSSPSKSLSLSRHTRRTRKTASHLVFIEWGDTTKFSFKSGRHFLPPIFSGFNFGGKMDVEDEEYFGRGWTAVKQIDTDCSCVRRQTRQNGLLRHVILLVNDLVACRECLYLLVNPYY
jgi:hypothetical protein